MLVALTHADPGIRLVGSGSPLLPTGSVAPGKSLPEWFSGWGRGLGFRITQRLGPPQTPPPTAPGSVSAGLGWGRKRICISDKFKVKLRSWSGTPV